MKIMKYLLLPIMLFFVVTPLYADIALLLHQPHSAFGFFNPTGHAALYLSRVCAESPVLLRRNMYPNLLSGSEGAIRICGNKKIHRMGEKEERFRAILNWFICSGA